MPTFGEPPGVGLVRLDSSGRVGVFDTTGTEILYFDGTANVVWPGSTGAEAPGTTAHIWVDVGPDMYLNVTANRQIFLRNSNSATYVAFRNGIATVYKGISTQGLGVPAIYSTSVQNPVNAAPTAVSYTPPATAGYYRVSYYLDITTATTITFIAKLTYTDPAGTARSANLSFINEGGTAVLAGGPAPNTAGQWYGSQTFAIDNSATAITVVNNAGTYTTCNYRWQVALEQLI